MMDRRSFNRLALGAPLLGSGILAAGSASAQSVDLASLMAPGPLPDKTLGDPQAPVTVVEYASLTCGHCASFHTRTYPALKERYVEAGQVFFVMRDFPLDAVAAAAAMLARCMPDDSYFTFIDLLFQQQRNWAFTDKPVDALYAMAQQGGMTRADFDACLTNQELFEGVQASRARAQSEFGVSSTPTFFVNGNMVRGAVSIDEFENQMEPFLEG